MLKNHNYCHLAICSDGSQIATRTGHVAVRKTQSDAYGDDCGLLVKQISN